MNIREILILLCSLYLTQNFAIENNFKISEQDYSQCNQSIREIEKYYCTFLLKNLEMLAQKPVQLEMTSTEKAFQINVYYPLVDQENVLGPNGQRARSIIALFNEMSIDQAKQEHGKEFKFSHHRPAIVKFYPMEIGQD